MFGIGEKFVGAVVDLPIGEPFLTRGRNIGIHSKTGEADDLLPGTYYVPLKEKRYSRVEKTGFEVKSRQPLKIKIGWRALKSMQRPEQDLS